MNDTTLNTTLLTDPTPLAPPASEPTFNDLIEAATKTLEVKRQNTVDTKASLDAANTAQAAAQSAYDNALTERDKAVEDLQNIIKLA